MVSQGIVKGAGIFSPSLVSVYRYAYMTGLSVTFSESASDRICHPVFFWNSYTNIGKFFETSKSKSIENKQVKSIGTVNSSRSCNMGRIYFRHIWSIGLSVYMDAFEVLFPEWLYFIDLFSKFFWKPFWILHRLSVYMEEDKNPVLSGIGITGLACYIFPIHGFWQCFVVDFCDSGTVQTMKPCFQVRFRPEIHAFKYVLYAETLFLCEF